MDHQQVNKKSLRQREDLTGEHRVGDVGQAVLAFLFTVIWIIDTHYLKCTTFLNQYVSDNIRISIGMVILLISGYLAITGLFIVFVEKREKPAVIRKGVFRIVRHPIYLSEILLYLGLLILNISLVAAVVWIIAIVFLHYISCYEEKLLLARFGQEYEQYMREVPMWLPHFLKK